MEVISTTTAVAKYAAESLSSRFGSRLSNAGPRDSAWAHSKESEIEVGSLDMGLALGYWAMKLQSCNLLSGRLTHREVQYKEDSERHIDEDGVLTIYRWSLVFSSACRTLHDLVNRSLARQEKSKQ